VVSPADLSAAASSCTLLLKGSTKVEANWFGWPAPNPSPKDFSAAAAPASRLACDSSLGCALLKGWTEVEAKWFGCLVPNPSPDLSSSSCSGSHK